MEFVQHSHRFGVELVQENALLQSLWKEVVTALGRIDDERLAAEFDADLHNAPQMSLSKTINRLLSEELAQVGWSGESAIFQDAEYSKERRWRLDFSKVLFTDSGTRRGIAIEVAFNHGEAIAWNLLKPVLASELNHVKKQIDIGSGVGVVITATNSLKQAGGFDSAVGSFEKFLSYLKPLQNQLTVPMIIVGLEAPKTFRIEKVKDPMSGRNSGGLHFN